MKKLMFAAMAVAAGTLLADVTSSNIVGYAGNDLNDEGGSVAVAPQFTTVGSATGLKLKDITPINNTTTSIRRKIQIQLLTKSGAIDTFYRWDGASGKTWIGGTTTDDMGEVEIPAGQGLWVGNTARVAVYFQTAGEVGTKDIIIPLNEEGGSVMVGNSFPVPVKLKNIVVSTETTTSIRRKIQIQLLTKSGAIDTFYRWDGASGKTWIGGTTTDDMGDVEIPAGQALWISNSARCQATVRIPAPEL